MLAGPSACANVIVYDPAARENAERNWPTLTYTDTMFDACRNADWSSC